MSCVTIEFVVCAPSTDKLLPCVYPKVDCRPAFVDNRRTPTPAHWTAQEVYPVHRRGGQHGDGEAPPVCRARAAGPPSWLHPLRCTPMMAMAEKDGTREEGATSPPSPRAPVRYRGRGLLLVVGAHPPSYQGRGLLAAEARPPARLVCGPCSRSTPVSRRED